MIATLHTSKFNIESTFAGFNYPRYIAALPRGSMADRLARRSPVVCGKTYQPRPDPDGDGDKVRGIVVRLSHGRGFLAGWAMGGRHGRDHIPGRVRRRGRRCQGGR